MQVTEDRIGQCISRLTNSVETWKKRVAKKQSLIRYLRVRVRDLEVSRDQWKGRAMAADNTSFSVMALEPEHSMDTVTTGE